MCRNLFVNKCAGCHTSDRKAGTAPGYKKYSSALKSSGVRWTRTNLHKYLRQPEAFIPGTKMFYAASLPLERQQQDVIIDYLEVISQEG